jgi:hypothetical protein
MGSRWFAMVRDHARTKERKLLAGVCTAINGIDVQVSSRTRWTARLLGSTVPNNKIRPVTHEEAPPPPGALCVFARCPCASVLNWNFFHPSGEKQKKKNKNAEK